MSMRVSVPNFSSMVAHGFIVRQVKRRSHAQAPCYASVPLVANAQLLLLMSSRSLDKKPSLPVDSNLRLHCITCFKMHARPSKRATFVCRTLHARMVVLCVGFKYVVETPHSDQSEPL